MTRAEHIDTIRRMAVLAKKTEVSLDEVKGLNRDLGIDYFGEDWRERYREKNIAEEALKEFLANRNLNDLERIRALMYSGRNGTSADQEKQDYRKDFPNASKEDYVRTISEKFTCLDQYLKKGIDRAKQDGIDIKIF